MPGINVQLSAASSVAVSALKARGRSSSRIRSLARNNGPATLAVQPTITTSASSGTLGGNTGIASSILYPYSDTRFHYSAPVVTTGNGMAYRTVTIGTPPGTQTGTRAAPTLISFTVDCQAFELVLQGNTATTFRVAVDGAWLSRTPAAWAPANDAQFYLRKFDFGSRAVRAITLEITNFGKFGGIRLGPNDTLFAPLVGDVSTMKVAAITDSFGYTVPGGVAADAWAYQMGLMLGWDSVDILAAGSTGIIANASGAQPNFRQRATLDLYPNTYDVIIVQGSINDANDASIVAAPAAYTAELTALLNELRTSNPNADIFVTGIMRPSAPQAADTTLNALISAACAGRSGVTFIDPSSPTAWFSGSGFVGSTTGTGNADVYRGTDGTHASTAGHQYIAAQMARVLATYYGVTLDKVSLSSGGAGLDDALPGLVLPAPGAWVVGVGNLNSNNFGRAGRFRPQRDINAVSVALVLTTLATNNDALEVVFYDASTLAKVATTGSVSGLLNAGTVPLIKSANLSAAFTFEAGRDYFYVVANGYTSGTAAQVMCAGFQSVASTDLFGSTSGVKRWGNVTGITPGSSPATLALDATAVSVNVPVIALREF